MNRPVLSLKPRAQPKPLVTEDKEVWFTKRELSDMDGQWKKVTGVLRYDPSRPGFRKSHKLHTLVLEMPRDQLDLYYQWFLEKKFGSWYALQRPMFGLHVTVIRGDEFKKADRSIWGAHCADQEITVEFNPTQLRKKWQFWSMPVRSKFLEDLRGDFGLPKFHDFHMTVAREYEWQEGVL